MSEYEHEAPVFIVEGWCFEPADPFPAPAYEEGFGPTLEQMAREGRFCPGASYPSPAEPDSN